MIRHIILILISFLPLLKSFAASDKFNTHNFNSELSSNVLIVINNSSKELFNEINNYLVKNSGKIPYKVTIAQVSDDLESSNFAGSSYFLDNELMQVPIHTFYIDHHHNSELEFYTFNNRILPDLNMVKRIFKSFNLENRQIDMFPLYMTDILPNPEILNIYNDKKVPVILFRGNFDINKLLNLLQTPESSIKNENFYLLASIFRKNIYIGELPIIIIISAFFLISFILMSLFSKRLLFHFRNNTRYLVSLPVKLVAVFIFYFISTLVLEYIVDLSGRAQFIYSYPKTVFFTKNLILYFIYSICFHIMKDTTFSKSPYLYSYISFFISMGIFIYISQIYLPLGLYQIWPMLMTIFFILSKERSSKQLFMILSPIVIIAIFIKYLSTDYTHFVDLFVISRYRGNILLTVFSSPYLFLQDSYHRFIRRRQNRVVIQKDIVTSVLLLTLTITLIAILLELNQKI